MLTATDWTKILSNPMNDATIMVEKTNDVIQGYMDQSFKTITKKLKFTDPPWSIPANKKQVRQRKRVFKKGRSSLWNGIRVTKPYIRVE